MGKDIAFIGISPGNSYFKVDRLTRLFTETVRRHGDAVVGIMDTPSVFTQLALGNGLDKAESKAAKKSRQMDRLVQHALESVEQKTRIHIRVLDWATEVQSNPTYLKARHSLNRLYKNSDLFQVAVNNAANAVLSKQTDNLPLSEQNLRTGGRYLINELALNDTAAKILNVDTVHYYYHRPWDVYERFIAGEFDGQKRTNQQFHVLSFE